MIRDLIELAEEMYARGHNPSTDPEANAADFREFAIKLGHQIEDVGMQMRRYQEHIERLTFHINHLQNKIKELSGE
jgi:peptidoglycan hydrolase CwlO-like protein